MSDSITLIGIYPMYKLGRLSTEQLQFIASNVAVFVDDVAATGSYTEEL